MSRKSYPTADWMPAILKPSSWFARETLLDELVGMFMALDSPAPRVGAAFVTASGKATEALQRMITS